MRKAKITAAIITKNEEENIEDCMKSIGQWADEIIVVDGYSEDKTASIAEGLGARVIKHRFEGDLAFVAVDKGGGCNIRVVLHNGIGIVDRTGGADAQDQVEGVLRKGLHPRFQPLFPFHPYRFCNIRGVQQE